MTSVDRQPLLNRFLRRRVADGWMPGAVWRVEDAGGCHARGAVGAASASLPYDLASLTKMLATAPLLLLAEQRGQLSLATPVAQLLDSFAGSPYAEVTLAELAAHESGLPAWKPVTSVEQIAGEAPAVPRGTVLYSDLGFIVLGAVLERVCGRRLNELFDEQIAGPLGLNRTGFALPGRFPEAAPTERGNVYERTLAGGGSGWRNHLLQGEVHDGNAHALGGVAGHAGLFGVAVEVAAIARELLWPRRLALTGRSREKLLRPVRPEGLRSVGLVLAGGSRAARGVLEADAVGHVGFTGTSVWLAPDRGRCYILLTNRVHPVVQPRDFQLVRRNFHRLAGV